MDKFKIRRVPRPWNKGKLVGQTTPLKLKEIWPIRVRLQVFSRKRELALFDVGIDSKLRASMEPMADLHAPGILTEAEFSAKKAELWTDSSRATKEYYALSAQVQIRGQCHFAKGMQSRYPSSLKQGIREIVRADQEDDIAPQSMVERRR